jgi:hypothetical protein
MDATARFRVISRCRVGDPMPRRGRWTYVRDSERLAVTWEDCESGADLRLQVNDRHESRYFDSLDDLFLYHALLERALVNARWLPVAYVNDAHVIPFESAASRRRARRRLKGLVLKFARPARRH